MKATNRIKGKIIPLFHGELGIAPTKEIPKGKGKLVKSYIAAHSETGHHHIIEADKKFRVYETDLGRFIKITELTRLYHAKTYDIHEAQVLAPGTYKLTEKVEYSPFTKLMTRVFD